jgi:hypothetical protein
LAIRAVISFEWKHKVAAATHVTGTFASRGVSDSDVEEGSHICSEIKVANMFQLLKRMIALEETNNMH